MDTRLEKVLVSLGIASLLYVLFLSVLANTDIAPFSALSDWFLFVGLSLVSLWGIRQKTLRSLHHRYAYIAALVAIVLPLVIPLPANFLVSERDVSVRMETGKDNTHGGVEVWLLNLVVDGREVALPRSAKSPTCLVERGSHLVVVENKCTVDFQMPYFHTAQLRLMTHPYSGKVRFSGPGFSVGQRLYQQQGQGSVVLELQNRAASQLAARRALSWLSHSIVLFLLVYTFCIGMEWLIERYQHTIRESRAQEIKTLDIPLFALAPFIAWLVFLWLFWPGIMSPDSYEQWYQMLTGSYNDNHPAFHTLINRAVTMLWESPAAVALFQILILALSVGYALAIAQSLGAPRWALYVTSFLVALLPCNGFMAVTLWKDLPFTAASIALSASLLSVLNGRRTRFSFCMLGVLAAILHLLRHNGIIPAVATVAILFFCHRTYRWWSVVSYVAITAIIRGPVYSLLGVMPISLPFYGLISLHFVTAHLAANTPITESVQQRLEAIRHLPDWPYECTSIGPIIWDGKLKGPMSEVVTPDIHRIAAELTWQRPWVLIDHYRCLSSYLWRIKPYPNIGYVEGLWIDFQPDGYRTRFPYGDKGWVMQVADQPRNDGPWVKEIVDQVFSADRRWLLERPGLWLYLLLFSGGLAAARTRSWAPLLFQIPLVCNSLAVTFIGTQQIFRYSYPLVLLSQLFLMPFLLLPKKTVTGHDNQDEESC